MFGNFESFCIFNSEMKESEGYSLGNAQLTYCRDTSGSHYLYDSSHRLLETPDLLPSDPSGRSGWKFLPMGLSLN